MYRLPIAFMSGLVVLLAVAGDPYDYKKTVQRQVSPVKVSTNHVGRILVDFGLESFGFLELLPPAGTVGKYEVRLGELLKDGCVDMEPGKTLNQKSCAAAGELARFPVTIRAARVCGRISGDEGGKVRVPLVPDKRNTTGGKEGGAIAIPPEHGVIMPFRYAEFAAVPFEITPQTVRQVAVNYPMDMSESTFACSDPRLERVYGFCKYTILATSFAGLYVDGDRERIPYEMDAYINQLGEYAVHSDHSLARASHEYLMEHPTWPTEWKQYSVKMAWADWMWTGDTRSVAKLYAKLKDEKLLLQHARASDGLLVSGGERFRHSLTNACGLADIVDWPACERDGFVFKDVNSVVNAMFYRNLLEMADIALALGKRDDAEDFSAKAHRVRASFQNVFFDPSRGIFRDGEGTDHASLHANAMALAMGIVPPEHMGAVADFCLSRGMACSVGFAQHLLDGLFMAGRVDDAMALMVSSGERSWLGMMDFGATVTMEAWSPRYKPNLDMNHAWGTPPLNVISRHVLGVTPLEPGFTKVLVRPQTGSLVFVSGKVPTARGPVSVGVANGTLTVETPVPARIVWGGRIKEVPPGRFSMPRNGEAWCDGGRNGGTTCL